jgi:hypothetical protein
MPYPNFHRGRHGFELEYSGRLRRADKSGPRRLFWTGGSHHPPDLAQRFTAVWTFDAVLVAFIGGIGTVAGPLAGAAFFVLVRDVLATNLTTFHLIIFGILFILWS